MAAVLRDIFQSGIQVNGNFTIISCAQRHKIQGVFRTHTLGGKGGVKGFPQFGEEGERAAQINHFTGNGTALCQTGNGLVGNRRKNAGGYVAFSGALIQKGLHIGFGKHTAPGSNGIDLFMLFGHLVHFIGRHVQQRGHLVNKRTGTACTGAVHTDFQSAGEEQNFRVLATQLNDGIRIGNALFQSQTSGVHFLNKGKPAAFGNTHTGASGHGNHGVLVPHIFLLNFLQQFRHLLGDLGVVAFIGLIQDVLFFVQYHTFDGSGTYIQSDFHHANHSSLFKRYLKGDLSLLQFRAENPIGFLDQLHKGTKPFGAHLLFQ